MIYTFEWREIIKPWRRRGERSLLFYNNRGVDRDNIDDIFVGFHGVSVPGVCRVISMEKCDGGDWSEIRYRIEVRSWIPVEFSWVYRGTGVEILKKCFRVLGSSMEIDYEFLRDFFHYCEDKKIHEQFRFHFKKTTEFLSVDLE